MIFTGTFDGTTLKGVISVSGMGIEIDFSGAKPGAQTAAAERIAGPSGRRRSMNRARTCRQVKRWLCSSLSLSY